MTLHAQLRSADRRRGTQAITAWMSDDKPALDEVLAEANQDPMGTAGLMFALLDFCAWIAASTGPMLDGDPGPGIDPREP